MAKYNGEKVEMTKDEYAEALMVSWRQGHESGFNDAKEQAAMEAEVAPHNGRGQLIGGVEVLAKRIRSMQPEAKR
jgi:hypothetical protein